MRLVARGDVAPTIFHRGLLRRREDSPAGWDYPKDVIDTIVAVCFPFWRAFLCLGQKAIRLLLRKNSGCSQIVFVVLFLKLGNYIAVYVESVGNKAWYVG